MSLKVCCAALLSLTAISLSASPTSAETTVYQSDTDSAGAFAGGYRPGTQIFDNFFTGLFAGTSHPAGGPAEDFRGYVHWITFDEATGTETFASAIVEDAKFLDGLTKVSYEGILYSATFYPDGTFEFDDSLIEVVLEGEGEKTFTNEKYEFLGPPYLVGIRKVIGFTRAASLRVFVNGEEVEIPTTYYDGRIDTGKAVEMITYTGYTGAGF